MWKASAKVLTPSDDFETYGSGPNPTRAAAILEISTTLATVVGKAIVSMSVTEDPDPTTEGLALKSIDDQFEDATLVLSKPGPLAGQYLTRTKHIENMDLAYKQLGGNFVNPVDPDVLAIVAAFRDGLGGNGYSLVASESKFSN